MLTTVDERLQTLLRGCAKNERASQQLLYQQFYGFAMGVCLRYVPTRDEALEVVNDGFLKVFTRLNQYDGNHPFKAWLRRIMVNTALDNYRKNARYYQQSQELTDATPDNGSAGAFEQLGYEALLGLVQQLSPTYRTVFNLFAIDGYAHEEIAAMLDISVGTSKSNLSKARANLRAMVINHNPNEYSQRAR